MADFMGSQRMVKLLLEFFRNCFRMLESPKTRKHFEVDPMCKDEFRTAVCIFLTGT